MKTTVEISDPLLRQARELAQREGVTLRTLVERGLHRVVAETKERCAFRASSGQLQGQTAAARIPRNIVGPTARSDVPGSRRVIAVDTNILVYAHREDSPFHELYSSA